jgi:hypothetical protein
MNLFHYNPPTAKVSEVIPILTDSSDSFVSYHSRVKCLQTILRTVLSGIFKQLYLHLKVHTLKDKQTNSFKEINV